MLFFGFDIAGFLQEADILSASQRKAEVKEYRNTCSHVAGQGWWRAMHSLLLRRQFCSLADRLQLILGTLTGFVP